MKKVLSLALILICIVCLTACGSSIRGKYAFEETNTDAEEKTAETYKDQIDETAASLKGAFASLTMEFKRGKAVFKTDGQPDEKYNYYLKDGAVSLTDEAGNSAEEKFFSGATGYSLKFKDGKVIIELDLGEVIRAETGTAPGKLLLQAVFKKI